MDEIIIEEDKQNLAEVELEINQNTLITELKNLEVMPSTEEQIFKASTGAFKEVKVLGDDKLISENIKVGTSIFGIEGKMTGSWDTSQIRQCYNMFYNNKEMIEAPYFDTSNVTSMSYMFYNCSNLKIIPEFNTSNVTSMDSMFVGCDNLEIIPEFNTNKVTTMYQMFSSCDNLETVPQFDTSKVTNIGRMFYNCSDLTELGGLLDLGKAYTQKTNNYSNYKLDLSSSIALTHESLMNVINNLYDLNLTYDVANGGTLYTQNLMLGSTNISKLSAEEIAIATNKGWTVS